MEVERLNLQFPFDRYGRRWIANRRVASLILQFARNRDRLCRPKHGSDAGSHFEDRYGDVLRDSELAFEHWHLLLDSLQVEDLGARIDCRCRFDSSGRMQQELNRLVAFASRRVDVNARRELNLDHEG